jgi:hypothetical protein
MAGMLENISPHPDINEDYTSSEGEEVIRKPA